LLVQRCPLLNSISAKRLPDSVELLIQSLDISRKYDIELQDSDSDDDI